MTCYAFLQGYVPLAANPDNPAATKEISRRHKITLSSSGLLSIIGGKWTSYRRMAEETIDKAIKAGMLENRKCLTRNLKLCGNGMIVKSERLKIYGSGAVEIEKMIEDQPSLGVPLSPKLPYTAAEIIWICRKEMPQTIEDVLARRTRALFLDARASLEIAPLVAGLMAKEFGFDRSWQDKQLNDYKSIITNYL